MDDLPNGFMDIVSSSSVKQCKSMLVYLNNIINKPNNNLNYDTSVNFSDYTCHVPDFLKDPTLMR